MSAVLQFDSVNKIYDSGSALSRGRRRFHALSDVSFALAPGETVGLVGESGSGKSTIARIACGLIASSSGSVSLLGQDLSTASRQRLRDLRAGLGFVFQDPYASLNPHMTIAKILELPFRVRGGFSGAEVRAAVADLLERVGLGAAGGFAEKRPHQLSGGQRQRVAIARAIALRPKLLIADEPVSALDVSISGQVLNLLGDIQREIGSTMLFISHDLTLVRAICDRALVLNKGRIVEQGPVEQVLENPVDPYTQQLLASIPQNMMRAREAARRTEPTPHSS
ncbi:ABC transporter ATP-binding protein [Rhizobium rhizogenes]|uniref:ABC transporter ATP-binding protein n=1 Tax=Rhizobium rhizogenes TaxID=359 RepID=UPI001572DE8A|nr:ATP-binding cassette domain-containing protein [Rhizobium rhizogenes]NTI78560.1 ABC transporter ATP-binding protein [Rhizobium rhizogenes]